MKFSAVFPVNAFANDAVAIRDWAQAAEGLGYSRIVGFDHVVGAVHENREPPLTGPYTEHDVFHEPLTLFAFLAGVTKTIDFLTGMIILPQRQTVLVAKQAAQIDIVSQGRLNLGVALGWNYVEYEALGVPYRNRGPRIDEQIPLLRRLWSEPVIDFTGTYHRIDRAGIAPRPSRRIPIWTGGFTEPAVRRAVKFADGFLFASASAESLQLAGRLRQALAEQGRDPAAFGLQTIVGYTRGPAAWREEFEAWKKAGADHFTLRAHGQGLSKATGLQSPEAIDEHIKALETFIRELQ
ncbi:MAG: LLM class F420-dependent oxidoreductase [Betaproteobacteria bacterium]|nr:LLM class F420-dependent oxidoreductase [Betaproteobacteria bacterium]